tara:strand:+ start:10005 stop:10241 length:237 start_codon:yes stop_codon:yes gene_type:complete
MGGLFGGGPDKPEPFKPTREQLEAEKQTLERGHQQKSEVAEREARAKRRMSGSRSSLLRGSALGVLDGELKGDKETLG